MSVDRIVAEGSTKHIMMGSDRAHIHCIEGHSTIYVLSVPPELGMRIRNDYDFFQAVFESTPKQGMELIELLVKKSGEEEYIKLEL